LLCSLNMRTSLWLLFVSAASLARGVTIPRSLPKGQVTCGSDLYSVNDITAAINAGVGYLDSGNLQDDYPHQFRDDEGLPMWCSGSPWYEWPILANHQIYSSPPGDYHSPGADRVVFTSSGTYCAVITHTGAGTTDGFVACKGD